MTFARVATMRVLDAYAILEPSPKHHHLPDPDPLAQPVEPLVDLLEPQPMRQQRVSTRIVRPPATTEIDSRSGLVAKRPMAATSGASLPAMPIANAARLLGEHGPHA
jgi:hypothetical protein